jgi:glycosyltransferase involved in cell wall biosynthesis
MSQKMQIKAIHQFSPSCGRGDGVSNGMFFTRSLLRELGFISEIYCELIPEDLQDEVHYLSQLQLPDDDLLLVHHSLGYTKCEWLNQVKAAKILIYHNITPPEYLPDNELPGLSVLGRAQLPMWAGDYLGAVGDSDINSAELTQAGYANVKTIPLLVDIERMRSIQPDFDELQPLRGVTTLLFVGRFCEHKHQLELIHLLQELRGCTSQPMRLILAGGITSDAYHQHVLQQIRDLGLEAEVEVTGKVTDARLVALYRSADVYVSLSAHEGFGMPLIEAMLYDVPVIAMACSGVPVTMGKGGILLQEDSSLAEFARQIQSLLTEPALRRRVLAAQRQNIQRFSRSHVRTELANYLVQVGVQLPTPALPLAEATNNSFWQIEGSFDSSYSLAIVNRELARTLQKRDCTIALRSREGYGDFAANADFLHANPDIAAMHQLGQTAGAPPDVVMRNCYPPFLDDMQGRVKLVHSYGWEETGFPAEYVEELNRKLDLVTVVSKFVGKVLRDNGVRVPIAVVGNGVDHLLEIHSVAPSADLLSEWRSFRFLHVSSCFPRKGVDVLLAAYGKAFRIDDDVSLIIKTFPNPHNDVEQQVRDWQKNDARYPHVVVINEDYTDAHLAGLYKVCHTVVAPSRGEGFGLPVAEAMVFDLPVITTAWSGQRDFSDETTAWLCDYQFAKSTSHFGASHSVWANPDTTHLASLLTELVNTPAELKLARTKAARERVLKHFSWSDVAHRTMQAIAALERQPALRKKPQIAWISTWNARCGVASYSSFLTTAIPAERLNILTSYTAERTMRDADNVFRCWDAGMDESLDYAFETIIERGIGAVVIQYNFGFFSLSTLASFIHRLKQAGIFVHIFFHATADVQWVEQKISLSSIADDLKHADRLYVHGVDDLNRLKNLGLVENVVFFPQGVMPTLAQAERTPDQSGESKKTIIAAYGFLLPHKGMQSLIRAFASLAQHNEKLHLLLVTSLYPASVSDDELRDCQKLIAQFNLAARVTLHTDYLTDTESQILLQTADLIVYPYQQTLESSSAAVRMGLAAGKPVAVTPLSIFDDVIDAVHVLPGSTPETLALGIGKLLQDEQAIAVKAVQAKAWVDSRQWQTLSTRVLNIIDGMANEIE